MSLFPFMDQEDNEVNGPIEMVEHIPIEYELDFETNTLTGRIVEGNEALKIWILKALKTKRYKHLIYSWDYGIELEDIISMNYDRGFIESEIARDIEEALTINSHIKSISNFNTTFDGDQLICDFTVVTSYGEVKINEKYSIL